MTGDRERELMNAADMLLDARRTGTPLQDLPQALRPADMVEVYTVQDVVAQAFGPIGGWKIGAPDAQSVPTFAPMPLAWMSAEGATLSGNRWRYRGLEAEIAFLLGEDLPPRSTPYTRDEVLGAVASCHPIVEELETAFIDPTTTTKFSMLADLQMHGGFIYGPAFAHWKSTDWNAERVTLAIDGSVRVERTGSNTSGDLLKLLPWLANEGAARTGGLQSGQWITTGSWTGNTQAPERSSVDVAFSTAGKVSFHFVR